MKYFEPKLFVWPFLILYFTVKVSLSAVDLSMNRLSLFSYFVNLLGITNYINRRT